jgi:hypothetical protein
VKIISNDIFADWRGRRFVVAGRELHDNVGHLIMLTDYAYWADHVQQLDEWCQHNGGEMQGMTVNLPTEQALTAFLLRWS